MIKGWPRRKVSELCEIIVDCVNKTAPTVTYATPYKMIRTSNIKNGRINLDNCKFVDKATYEKWTRRAKVKEGDILLTREAPMGEVGLVNYKDLTFLGQRIMQYRVDSRVLDSRFLFYSFLSPDLQFQFRRHNNGGSTVSHICVPDCFEFEVNTPSLVTQQKIASVLSALDGKIELNNKINAELEAMAKTLYDYWFVQFDFPNAEGKPYKSSGGEMVYDEVLKREIPKGWEVKSFKFLNLYQPQTISEKEMKGDGEYVVFGANGIVGRYDKYNHENSEIVITCRGNSCGNILRTTPFSWITGNAMVVNSISTSIPTEFIYQMLNWVGIKKIITGSGQPQITRTNLETLNFVLPSEDILKKFGDFSSPIVERKLISDQQNQELASLRDWLLPMLMNGQVRVAEAYKEVEEKLAMVAETEQEYKLTR